MDTPPPYTGGKTPSHRAWARIGQIFFWRCRGSDAGRTLWSQLGGPTRLAVADVLYNVVFCDWKLAGDGRSPVDLVAIYPDDIRAIVEDCLRERKSLPTVFNYGGSRDRNVVSYLIDVLGRVGDENSARLLQTLIDDLECGKHAILAIESIRKSAAHPIQG